MRAVLGKPLLRVLLYNFPSFFHSLFHSLFFSLLVLYSITQSAIDLYTYIFLQSYLVYSCLSIQSIRNISTQYSD